MAMPLLIRRITRDLRNQDWIALFLDFIVVVLGILVAVQVEEWRQYRSDRAEERQVLFSISQELSADAEEINIFIEAAEGEAATMNGLLESLKSEGSLSPDRFAQNLIDALFMYTLNFSSPTYDGLKDNGRLRIIHSEELRENIVSYYEGAAPFLKRREELAVQLQLELISKSRPWIFRSSIDEPFPGWTVVEVDMPLVENVWRFAVSNSVGDIASNMEWIALANDFAYRLTEFGYRADATLQRIEELRAAIDARLAEFE